MDIQKAPLRYRLGIDVGVASLGVAILTLKDSDNRETGEPEYDILGGYVRTYPIPEGAAERREKRGMRRNIERRERRLDRLADLLAAHGMGSRRKDVPKEILDLSPIKMRAMASRGKVEPAHLARALLHMARHRGSSAIRGESDLHDKADTDSRMEPALEEVDALAAEFDLTTQKGQDGARKKLRDNPISGLDEVAAMSALEQRIAQAESDAIKDDKENRQTAEAIKSLRKKMKDKGFTTYGQYLRWLEKKDLPIRINQKQIPGGKDGYDYYPSRKMLREEFHVIWDRQAKFYPKTLTDDLKKEVEDEIFFQRAVTSPPPGKCPYFPEEFRLPRTSRAFQIRRVYEEANNLRFDRKRGGKIAYGLAERDKIVARLKAGEDLTSAELKKTLGLERTATVSLEDVETREGIKGYPFDRALGAPEALGDDWLQADEHRQDQILEVLATVHDDDKAAEALTKILGGDGEAAKRALQAPLPGCSGWGRMGPTATAKILKELKKDVVSTPVAGDRAGLVHAMAGVNRLPYLPYYGKILVGHTVDPNPMWVSDYSGDTDRPPGGAGGGGSGVSDYRRDTDRPPNTDPNEREYGRIPNPVVHLALNQIRRVVNAVIEKHGLPESIHIELARELNKSAEARKEIEKQNARNKKANDKAAAELEKFHISINRLNIQKYKLWKEQGGECVYTGKSICMERLYGGDVDVDHILPRSKTFSDSLANKVVCLRSANADKNNRAPYQAFAHDEKYDWDKIMRRVEKLQADHSKRLRPKKVSATKRIWVLVNNKKWRFKEEAMKKFEEDENGFRTRYENDNSYIARVAAQYLTCLYGKSHKDKVVAVSSHIVSLLRGKWGLNKILGDKIGINAITKALPGEITTSKPHGLSTGDRVRFTDIEGMAELNNRDFTVTVTDTDTDADKFTFGEDTSTLGAYESGGKVLGAKKNRDDHSHHFIDALTAACATPEIIQRIQTEVVRCEGEKLDAFVEKIAPLFGTPKEFFNAACKATLERVALSRKADHSAAGQLHEDTLMGIIDGPDEKGAYVCRKRKKLTDYNTLEKLEKPKIRDNLPDSPEIEQAREDLETIRDSVRNFVYEATQVLEEEREADMASGKKGKKISHMAVYSRAVQLHKESGGKTGFILYEKNKLVNARSVGGANRPYGGYISSRNHRKDFYLDNKGKPCWQLVSMMEANDKSFRSKASLPGNRLLWSAHKEDVLIMDDPDDPNDPKQRIQVVVAKFDEEKMGVVPESDARDSKKRKMWEKGLSFFRKVGAQRIVTDALGGVTWRFPALPR